MIESSGLTEKNFYREENKDARISFKKEET